MVKNLFSHGETSFSHGKTSFSHGETSCNIILWTSTTTMLHRKLV